MKNFLFIASFLACTIAANAGRVFYAATNGSNSNPGTISAPWASWEMANGRLTQGDTLYLRGGTYRSTKGNGSDTHLLFQNLTGSASQRIVIAAYGIEQPIFNLENITPTASDPTALKIVNCSYVTFSGFRITGLKQITSGAGVSRAVDLQNSPNNKLVFIEADHIGGYGFILSDGSSNNNFINCDAHHMDDRFTTGGGAWGNANGFQCTGGSTATNCTFDRCRAWWISDDGFDLYGVSGFFTFKDCWAFWNGYEPGTFTKRGDGDGFKLGPHGTNAHNTVLRVVSGCLSFENANSGFDQNNGDLRVQMYNNTSFKNRGQFGYMWDYISPAPSQDFRNNISFQDNSPRRGNETTGSFNSWNGFTLTAASFKSISSAGADGPRGSDGSLPNLDFMKPATNSAIVNAGVDVGRAYSGTAPELGAFEVDQVAVNSVPTVNASGAITIYLPLTSVTVSAVGSDTDGTIVSYLWEKVSGPSAYNIVSKNSATTAIRKLTKGRYIFRVTVTDNAGSKANTTVAVTVNGYQTSFGAIPSGARPANGY